MSQPLITDPFKDPLGQAALDYQLGMRGEKIRVFSDMAEDDIIPVEYLFRGWGDMPAWEQKALNICKGHVLDIGAGAGTHTYVLQLMGLAVTAIDISLGAVQVMKERQIKNAFHQDFFSMAPSSFDTLLLLMNGIGIVGNLQGLGAFLTLAKSFLSPQGQIILDSSDLIYLYENEDEVLNHPSYYGEVSYHMEYKGAKGALFNWLFLDEETLKEFSQMHGYSCEILHKGPHYEYLARLSLMSS
ncbi:MAG: methyltransferase domain-containing protein [Bacteroidota bacterium]